MKHPNITLLIVGRMTANFLQWGLTLYSSNPDIVITVLGTSCLLFGIIEVLIDILVSEHSEPNHVVVEEQTEGIC